MDLFTVEGIIVFLLLVIWQAMILLYTMRGDTSEVSVLLANENVDVNQLYGYNYNYNHGYYNFDTPLGLAIAYHGRRIDSPIIKLLNCFSNTRTSM